jgi:hypothetical protein
MVLYRNHIPLLGQEEIGNALGLTVPEEDAYLFQSPHLGEQPKAGWGTQIYKEEFSLNTAFSTLDIPLEAELHLIDEYETVEQITTYLVEQQDQDGDILVCYNYGALFDTESTSGHVNVFDSIDTLTNTITLVDPEQKVPKYRHVTTDKLFTAMVSHGADKSAGFWKLSSTH